MSNPLTATRIAAHNRRVDDLWAAFGRGENERVPICFETDESLWLKLTGDSFRDYYIDPRVQLRVTLEGMAWCADSIVHDRRMGPPADAWQVAPRWWMDEPEWFGCEVTIQEDDFAWSRPLDVPKDELLARIADIDPFDAVRKSRLWALYGAMKHEAEGMHFRDLPVSIVFPGGGTHGLFTIAARVRGEERLCTDLLEDPDFAREYLGVITEKTIARIRAWHELAETGAEIPHPGGWGMADDSLQMISRQAYVEHVLPHHERIYAALTTGARRMHLCGYAQQHFGTLYGRLGVRWLDGPGPFADLGELLTSMPELRLSAQTDHTVLMLGPVGEIDEMMRGMLTEGTKQPGRYSIHGFLAAQTPLEHVCVAYEAGRRYGAIGGR